jgi:type VI secretion system protein ImpL
LQQVRTRYFRQFGRVLLFDMNAQMVAGLNGLPTRPDPNAPSDLVYRTLKGHLMISSAACGVESPFVSRLLKDMRAQMVPAASPDWQVLADRQIDFYSAELARGNPLKLSEDADAREHARQYLRNAQGIDRLYANILASAENKLGKTTRLSDLASNYTQVLSGPDEMSSAFSREGWALVEKASKENNTAAPGDACVLGSSSGAVSDWKQNSETAQAVQRLYFHDYIERWRKFVEGFSVTRYSNAGDAARKLDILADHKSPLLAVLAMTANHTNFPVAAEPTDTNVVQKTANKLLAPFKKAETEVKAVVGTPAEASDGLSTPADVTRYFQPVHSVEPPGSETWVVEKNAAYIDALAQLRRSMQDIAQGGNPADLGAVHQAAGQNYEKALEVVRQISKSFKPVGVGGLDATVERLLEEPIRQTSAFIIRDTTKIGTGKINADLRNFCISQSKTLRKYPFQPSSTEDATLDDFSALFDPMRGGIWKFQQQALGEFIVKEGAQWKSKDPAKKPQVTPDLLAFLNRAQSVTDIFFAAGPQPQFSYTFRPKLDSRLKDSTLELDVDGRPFQWTTPLQHQFSWPAPPGSKETGAVARLRSGSALVFAFASRGGIWGVFRILNDAEPREMGAKLVEWRYTTGSAGRREPMSVPVQLEIVGFPAGQDVFHPKFWEGLRCPSVAVQ